MSDSVERKALPPVIVPGELFLRLNDALVERLRSLRPAEWDLPTVCEGWTVKDVAAHILDGMLRRLSIHRDGFQPVRTLERCGPPSDLAAFIAKLNRAWTDAADRWSPRLLVDLIEWAEPQCAAFFDALPAEGEAIFPVSWAGEAASRNWLDVARDFTERWNHHRQIAEAVGRGAESLDRVEFRTPVYNAYARAFPPALAEIERPDGSVVRVSVDREAGLVWDVVRRGGAWSLFEAVGAADAEVMVPPSAAWLVFTKRWRSDAFWTRFPELQIIGDRELGERILHAVAMVA